MKILLVILMLFVLVACGGTDEPQPEQTATETTLTVTGLFCQSCVNVISRELHALDGVNSVSLDLNSGVLVVQHEPNVSSQEISDIIVLEGFGVE